MAGYFPTLTNAAHCVQLTHDLAPRQIVRGVKSTNVHSRAIAFPSRVSNRNITYHNTRATELPSFARSLYLMSV